MRPAAGAGSRQARPLPPSASAPASETATTLQKPDDHQKQNGANSGVDDCRDNSRTEMDTNLRQQPVANERADNTNYDIAYKPEASPSYDFAGQPTGNKTHHQNNQ